MRVVKLGIISLIVFGVIVYLFSLFIPSHVRISRAMTIGRSKADISAYIADMRTWSEWNQMIISQDSNSGNFGKKLYKSPRLKVEIVDATSDSVITNWQYRSSDPVNSGFYLVQSLSDTTVTQWYFDFHLDWYPWEKFGSIIFDQQLGPPMEKSLLDLKNTLENQPR
jgi:hypothetical protein